MGAIMVKGASLSEAYSLILRRGYINIVHKDLDKNSIGWATDRIVKICRKSNQKIKLEVPLLPVKPGHKVVALGKTWFVEGVVHRITPHRATTIIYGRLA